MKATALALVLAGGLAAVLPVPMYAQRIRLKADIPFEFIVRNKVMPAGQYIINALDDSHPYVLRLTEKTNGQHEVLLTIPVMAGGAGGTAQLVFHRYGTQSFLWQIWTTATGEGIEFPKSKTERELMARVSRKDVVILAKR